MDAIAGDKPFILHPDGVGMVVRHQRTEGWSAADALRAAGDAVRQPALSRAHLQSRRPTARSVPTIPTPVSPTNVSRTSSPTYRLTEHHTAGGMSRTALALGGVAARVVLRSFARTGCRSAPGARRLGHHHDAARHHRGPGAGDTSACGRCGSRAELCTRSDCRTTGATTA